MSNLAPEKHESFFFVPNTTTYEKEKVHLVIPHPHIDSEDKLVDLINEEYMKGKEVDGVVIVDFSSIMGIKDDSSHLAKFKIEDNLVDLKTREVPLVIFGGRLKKHMEDIKILYYSTLDDEVIKSLPWSFLNERIELDSLGPPILI